MTMNKKTIAIAALALFATSGLASARTVHAPKAPVAQTETNAQYSASTLNAENSIAATEASEFQAHPGDNDMDRYDTQVNN
jgi:hypothetical protein